MKKKVAIWVIAILVIVILACGAIMLLKGNDIEDIKAKKEELTKASQNVAMKAYQKAQQAQQKNSSSNEDSDTVDADYTDVE